jgi:membrane protease YdiL (CAAX protease family)
LGINQQWRALRMKNIILLTALQLLLLAFLLRNDKNDGGRELFKKQSWKALDVSIIVLSVDFFSFILHYLLKFDIIKETFKPNPFILDLILFFSTLAIYELKIKQNLTYLGFNRNNLKRGFPWAIGVALISYGIHEILIIGIPPGPKTLNLIRALKDSTNVWFCFNFVFLRIILGPLFEECVYRGILYSPYRKKYGPKIAILLTAVFFYIGHLGSDPIHIFVYAILAGVLYEKTESIISTIIAHSAYNLFVLLSALYLH